MAILGQEKLEALRKKGLDLGKADTAPQDSGAAKATAEILARQLIARLADKPPTTSQFDETQSSNAPARTAAPLRGPAAQDPSQETTQRPLKDPAPGQKPAAPRVAPRKQPDRDALLRRVAQYVTPQTLPLEHPAVIARLILGQGPEHRMAVLRALSGPKARAVAHFMRLMKRQTPRAEG
ncbi:hypothetical protein OE810_06345 [Rhodobacteraceae bacterium XHP0102]|nr:hypothetical protein [Rhodobacteraceae bacterium XHP0102]